VGKTSLIVFPVTPPLVSTAHMQVRLAVVKRLALASIARASAIVQLRVPKIRCLAETSVAVPSAENFSSLSIVQTKKAAYVAKVMKSSAVTNAVRVSSVVMAYVVGKIRFVMPVFA